MRQSGKSQPPRMQYNLRLERTKHIAHCHDYVTLKEKEGLSNRNRQQSRRKS